MVKVAVEYIGIPHFLAACCDCEWCYEDSADRVQGRLEIRRHVRQTGHMVTLEKAVVVRYTAVSEED
jgi:hypothetical protein